MAEEEAQVLAAAAKLPLEEQVAHSNWKARSAAYETIKSGCNGVFDPSDPILGDYASVFGKATADGNAAALDKALEALAAWLDKAGEDRAIRLPGSVYGNIAAKTLGARASTASKGLDCLMGLVELGQADKATGALVENYGHKVPKVAVGSLDATLQLIRAFGGRVMPAQQVLKALPPLFESKDAKARDRVKEIVAELARWMGPDLIRAALFEKMRDAMKEDVEKLLQEAPSGRPKPERLTRAEAAKAAAAAAAASTHGADDGAAEGGTPRPAAVVAVADDEPDHVDSYEFAEPRDIIPELKKEFWEGLESAKWSERKAALTSLRELAAYPRLANGDYADVNRELKKIIGKDSNINVVAEAMQCTANIAKGLRRDYKGAAMSLCALLLGKFKEKALVAKAAGEALDAMAAHCFALLDVAEDISTALAAAHPKVREGTLVWLASCVARESKQGVVKLVGGGVIGAAAKCTDDGAPAIREAAMGFLVQAALKAGSLTALDKGLSVMDDAKRKRLEEQVVEAARGRQPGAAAAAAPAAAGRAASRPASKPASGAPSPTGSPRGSRPGTARAAPARNASSNSRPGTAGARPRTAGATTAATAGGGGSGGGGMAADEDEAALAPGLMGAGEAKERFAELIGEELAAALGDAQWKVRLEAMESVAARAQEPGSADSAPLLVQAMAHLPGWDEKNFQVMSKQFEVIRSCAAHPSFGKREALVAVTGAVDKLADMKLKEPASQMLLAAAEAVGPQQVAALLHKRAVAHKNPKVLTEAYNWINGALTDFLLTSFRVPALLEWAKEGMGSANAATRTAAVQLLGTMHAFLGSGLADMVRPDLKPALMATVEAEFAKKPQTSDWTAARVSRIAAKPAAGKARSGGAPGPAHAPSAAADEPAAPSFDDLLPRADISGAIGAELLGKLGSTNWKERKEGLDEVDAILAGAGGRIQPCVGDLMPALKGRFSDTNKNLVAQALGVVASLARAMGRPIAREARPILAPAVKCICDSKANVRAAVIELLEAWVSVAPPDAPFDEVLSVLPSPKCVSEGMQAVIAWMASVYAAGKGSSPECMAAAARAAGLGAAYKTLPVREAAMTLLEAMVGARGLPEVQRAVQGVPDKALAKAAADALAKVAAATGASGGGGGGPLAPQASATSLALPRAPAGAGSRPGTAGGAGASPRPGSRPGGGGGSSSNPSSRPGSGGGQPAARALGASGSTLSRAGQAAAAAAPAAGNSGGGGGEGPLLAVDRNKEERARKIRYKSSKFELRPDEAQALEAELAPLASPGLRASLFAKDFKKQVAAADMLRAWIAASPEEAYDPCVCSLDLLLRWSVLRLVDGNTQTLVGVTAMLKALFELLAGQGYRLSDAEAKVFMPGLVEKCGQPQPNVKADCRDLMVRVSSMHSATKVVAYVQEGLHSKNNRSRVACAEEIGCLIGREGPKLYTGTKCDVLAVLAKVLAEPGKDIRAAALGALEVAYQFEGEGLWRQLGNLNGQQRGILEERFKTLDKELAKKGLAPGYRKAAFQAAAAAAAAAEAAGPGGGGAPEGPLGGSTALSRVSSSTATAQQQGFGGGGGAQGVGGGYGAAAAHDPNAAAAVAAGLALRGGHNSGVLSSQGSCEGPAAPAGGGIGGAATAAVGGAPHAPQGGSRLMAPTPEAAFGGAAPMAAAAASAGAAAAAGLRAGAAAAGAAAPHYYQPLQSFSSQAEIYAEFEKCMRVLQDGAMDDVIEVMKLLCYEMMDLARTQAAAERGGAPASPNAQVVWQLLHRQCDTLVVLLTIQTGKVFNEASCVMAQGPPPQSICRACKYALNTLMNIFSSASLPQGLRQESLGQLVRTLLLRLVDDNLGRQAEGEALLKALNVLMLKILENSNRNFTFNALLGLLLDTPHELGSSCAAGADVAAQAAQQQQQQARWADLVVKCLIKSTKALPQVIQVIDLRALLLSIHGFFEALGVEEIRRRSSADDKPLRMVKTILHELCKIKGTDIYRYTADIPQEGGTSRLDGAKPVILTYLDVNVQALHSASAAAALRSNGAGAGNGALQHGGAAPAGIAPAAAGAQAAAAMGAGSYGAAAGGAAPMTRMGSASGPAGAGGGGGGAATPGAGLRAAGAAAGGGGGVCGPKENLMAKLSDAFSRLCGASQAASSTEKHAALLDIYAVSQEGGLPIEGLMEQYLPDTTPAFRNYLVAELHKIDDEQQQQQQQQLGASTTAAPGSSWQAQLQHQQLQQADAGAAPGSGRQPVAAAGAVGGETLAELRARMTHLQSAAQQQQQQGRGAPAAGTAAPLGGGGAGPGALSSGTPGAAPTADHLPGSVGAKLMAAAAAGGGGGGLVADTATIGVAAAPSPAPAPVPASAAAAPAAAAAAAPAGSAHSLADLRSRLLTLSKP